MILIKLNDNNFEYDIYSLVKSFYPKEDIKFVDDFATEEMSYFCMSNKQIDKETIRINLDGQIGAREDSLSGISKIDELEDVLKCNANNIHLTITYMDTCIELEAYGNITRIDVEPEDRKETKNRLKRLIYDALSKETGIILPWGTLSGIRPTKIPLRMIEEGKSKEDIASYMKDTYYTSCDKINLSIDIAAKEYDLLKTIDYENGYSLYIGIPFCPSTCLYCSFPSFAYGAYRDKVESYLEALSKEIDFVSDSLSDKKLDTIYIGGGTPTSLEPSYLDRLLTKIDNTFDVTNVREYTIEAGRPDSITREKLEVIRKHGIDRISINPQTMNQKTLDLIGRFHKVEDIVESFNLARELGFENINMDLIIGLPGETIDDVKHTLEEISQLKPDSLTVHSLAIKRSSRLNIEMDEYEDYIMENSTSHMENAYRVAEELGMKPYYLYRQKNMAGHQENVGFALPGKEGLYNILIMEEKQTIMALGVGAACKYVKNNGYTVTRSENVKDVDLYINRIDEMIERKRVAVEGWKK